ncbi:MAG: hypothetical protein IJP67_02635 [Oscillospiraceae bacterium]|nr:hypothetical protein [Oscillospiraceae bacterium]
MEENNVSTEVIAETDIAGFDDGWGDEAAAVTETGEDESMTETEAGAEATADQPEENADTTPQAEAQDAGEPEETETGAGDGEKKDETKPFKLKYLGREVEVNSEEIVTLAQKGMDYDRQRSAHDKLKGDIEALGGMDEVKDGIDFLKELAGEGGSIRKVIDSTRAAMLQKSEGISAEEAAERIEKRNKERVNKSASKEAKTEESTENEKIRSDFVTFAREHPEVKAEDIPKEVWAEVNTGKTLSEAWAKHENARLRAELEASRKELAAEKQKKVNKERATPSMKGAGDKSAALDPFTDGWDN